MFTRPNSGGERNRNHKTCSKIAPKNPKSKQLFGSGATNGWSAW
ncbi:hypothetical protein ACFLS9_08900 [Bacteroidota bacterium]